MSALTPSPDLEYYMGKLQPQYDSEGQAKIGRMLNEYGIPFFYKQATMVFDNGRRTIWRPDFTLPTYNNVVIQYYPSSNGSSSTASKSDLARGNNIAALFLNGSDLVGPDWQKRLYDRLEELYHEPFTQRIRRNPQDRY
jgi:hypothetical protein